MKYHNITHDDMLNGDGIRVVVWVSGCEHHCKGCQNPLTWHPDVGKDFEAAEFDEIAKELSKSYVSGITFSGGDPLHPANRHAVLNLIQAIHHCFPDKTVWIYTGYTWEDVVNDKTMRDIIFLIDVLVDGKFEEGKQNNQFHWAGSTNQRVIDVQKTIQKGMVVLHESH